MKLTNLKTLLWSLFLVALLVALPYLCSEAQAQRGGGGRGGGRGGGGGGYHGGGGGFSGGSMRGGAGGPSRGAGGAGRPGGPGGVGGAGRPGGPGGVGAPGRGAGGAYQGNVNVNRNVTASRNWNAYTGPGYRPYAGAAAAGLAVGATVAYLSASAQPVAVNNQTYYVDGNTYYQKCYQGTEVSYCVVPDPYQ